MRKLPAAAFTLLLAGVGLTACASDPVAACAPAPAGSSSALVNSSGTVGVAPSIDFPRPLIATSTERTVNTEGTGYPADANSVIGANWSLLDGRSGELLDQTDYAAEPALLALGNLPPGLAEALRCAQAGDRISAVIPAEEMASGGAAFPGIGPTDSLVAVFDIDSVYPSRATGRDVPVIEPGFPTVVTDENGTPGLTIPKSEPSTELKVATLKRGDGPVVEADDTVLMHYTGALWSERTVFDSSWERGLPARMNLAELVPGFRDAVAGQTVGSQVIAVIPPELAYGDAAQGTVPAGSTLVFVIDILGAEG